MVFVYFLAFLFIVKFGKAKPTLIKLEKINSSNLFGLIINLVKLCKLIELANVEKNFNFIFFYDML